MNPERKRNLNNIEERQSAVLCLLNRDRRSEDNWALFFAQKTAIKYRMPLYVASCIDFNRDNTNYRNMSFLLYGLEFLEKDINALNIHFELFTEDIERNIAKFVEDNDIGIVVSDFSPLSEYQSLNKKLASALPATFYEVDAHNIVPAFYASDKQEFAAFAIRPKIKRNLKHFLYPFPRFTSFPYNENVQYKALAEKAREYLNKIEYVKISAFKAGVYQEEELFSKFIKEKYDSYATLRNNPDEDCQSDLSPFINYGFISVQRIVLFLKARDEYNYNQDVFLEELIIRRELSDNFCLYNPDYMNTKSFPDWAKKTLSEHINDPRPHIYSLDEFEKAATHDIYWNASQKQMLQTGKMHGYMRMYWCKKILEWTESPEIAMETAIYLNDKYSIDGLSPNGYAGIAWSIGAVHDRPMIARNVFGKIRYMNEKGLKRKFSMKKYLEKWN